MYFHSLLKLNQNKPLGQVESQEGLANRNIRRATGFIEVPVGEVRKEYIYHFAYVDLKSSAQEWFSIDSWVATDHKIRALEISFEPDPTSYQGLAVIDEIELWTRESIPFARVNFC